MWPLWLLPTVTALANTRSLNFLERATFLDDPGHVHALPRFPAFGHEVKSLDGYWRYAFNAEAAPTTPDANTTTWVPNALPTKEDATPSRGFALLEREIEVPAGHSGRLQFYGCAMSCTVKLGDKTLVEHAGGYTVFWADVPEGTHTLRVIADSRLGGDDSAYPTRWYDFLQYGGITRPVTLHLVKGNAMIEGVDVLQHAEGKATLRFRIHRFTEDRSPIDVDVTSDYLVGGPTKFTVSEENDRHDVTLEGARWSPTTPNLATMKISAPSLQDSFEVRFGLRTVTSCKDNGHARVCLDGEPIKLLGFCMHNVDVKYDSTVPRETLKEKMRQAKEAGGNFLRLVHYPHDLLTLELADEMGVLLWSETLGWGNHYADLTRPSFDAVQISMLNEAVPQTFNHPSVVLYGFLNEGDDTNPEACGIYNQLSDAYKTQWKVNGLVTYASNTYENDKCESAADVVGYNLYPGWYTATVPTIPNELARYASYVETSQGKPFIIAELGAAAIPKGVAWKMPEGNHPQGALAGNWSEEYQSAVDGSAAEAAVCNEQIAGIAFWELFDTRTTEKRQPLRPRGFNNKGLLTESGIPKMAYAAVQRAFTKPCHAGPIGLTELARDEDVEIESIPAVALIQQ